MTDEILFRELRRIAVENRHRCFGCGFEHSCGIHGCAIIREALERLERTQCIFHGCADEVPPGAGPEEIDRVLCDCMMGCPGCPVALAYCFASQAVHLRSRLKLYEDIFFAEDGTELFTPKMLQGMRTNLENSPLTLEELREMEGEPVWTVTLGVDDSGCWELCSCETVTACPLHKVLRCVTAVGAETDYELDTYGKTWLAYRRRPEEGTA